MIPAVSYLRMSKDSQDASIPAQRTAVKELEKSAGYRIIREYVDLGISGDATEKRTEFLRMMADVSKGDFRAVLCWDQDRFGRFDPLEAGFWIKPMRDAGIRLVTVAQGAIDWNDFAGRLIYSVQQEGKHQFLRDLSRNTNRGKMEAAKQGRWMGGGPPYGFLLGPDQHLIEHGPEAEIVRQIFERYVAGDSMRAICQDFNRSGIPSPENKLWNVNAIKRIVSNRVYLGHTRFNKKSAGKYTSIANGIIVPKTSPKDVWNDESLWMIIENTHSPLVDIPTFEAAQNCRTEHRRFAAKSTTVETVFRGLLKCGHCGAAMHAMYVPKLTDVAYLCARYLRDQSCNPNRTYQKPLLDHVMTHLSEHLTKEGIEAMRQSVLAHFAPVTVRGPSLASLKARLATAKRKLTSAETRLVEVPQDMIAVVASQVRQLRSEVEELELLIQAADAPRIDPSARIESCIEGAVRRFQSIILHSGNGPSLSLAAALRAAFDKIVVWSSKKRVPRIPQGRYEIDRIEIFDKSPDKLQ